MMLEQNPYYEPFSFKSAFRNFVTRKSLLNKLIVINIAVYLCYVTLKLFLSLGAFLFNSDTDELILHWLFCKLSCPASVETLLTQPWSIVTSIFFHVEFLHIFFNMIMLWVAGKTFTQYLDEKQLLATYFIGGMCGNALYIAAYNFFPAFNETVSESMALGASGGIMAILVAITAYKPHHVMQIGLLPGRGKAVRLINITAIFLVIDLLSIPHGNAGGHIAHLGGAIYGVLTAMLFSKHLFSFPKRKKKNRKKQKFYTSYNNSHHGRAMSDEEYNFQKKQQEDKLDRILDKISKSGYDALSKEEKEFLFFTSKRKQNE